MKKTACRYLLATVAGLAATLAPLNLRAAPGDLYETDIAGNTIYKFALASISLMVWPLTAQGICL